MNAMNGQTSQRNDPNTILNDCREVNRGIEEVEQNINKLRGFYLITTSITSNEELEAHRKKINELQEITMALYRRLTERMKKIRTNPESGNPRNDKQVGATIRRLKLAINEYQKAEAEHRARENDQGRRQYLTIAPEATEEEVEAAIQDGTGNLYTQAVSMMILEIRQQLTSIIVTSRSTASQCTVRPSGGSRSESANPND
jgi:syntaxin 1B/2/3